MRVAEKDLKDNKDIISSSKLTVRFSGHIMSADKYLSIFSRQMEAIYIIATLQQFSFILSLVQILSFTCLFIIYLLFFLCVIKVGLTRLALVYGIIFVGPQCHT